MTAKDHAAIAQLQHWAHGVLSRRIEAGHPGVLKALARAEQKALDQNNPATSQGQSRRKSGNAD